MLLVVMLVPALGFVLVAVLVLRERLGRNGCNLFCSLGDKVACCED